jgi:hypothetical protein
VQALLDALVGIQFDRGVIEPPLRAPADLRAVSIEIGAQNASRFVGESVANEPDQTGRALIAKLEVRVEAQHVAVDTVGQHEARRGEIFRGRHCEVGVNA